MDIFNDVEEMYLHIYFNIENQFYYTTVTTYEMNIVLNCSEAEPSTGFFYDEDIIILTIEKERIRLHHYEYFQKYFDNDKALKVAIYLWSESKSGGAIIHSIKKK